MNVILCGLPKCGKTTFAKLLAERVVRPFIDTDDLLMKAYLLNTGKSLSCRQIYLQEGEAFFRELEKQQIASLRGVNETIIALGGGSLDLLENREILLCLGRMIYLKTPLEIIAQRIDNHTLPLQLFSLANARIPLYEKAAHAIIETKALGKQEIVETLLREIGHGK